MMVLITYDVCTINDSGVRRLHKVAKICVNYGQRVQASVFECLLSPAELCKVKSKLLAVIDQEKDSLRFYNLGNSYHNRIEYVGAKQTYLPDDPLIF